MRHQSITLTFLLLACVLQSAAQALTDRFNRNRPVVIVCEWNQAPCAIQNGHGVPEGCLSDLMTAVTRRLGLPCRFIQQDRETAEETFDLDEADLILTDKSDYPSPTYTISETVVAYQRLGADSIAQIRFVSKDHYLVEQLDDQLMRMRLNGEIAAMQDQCKHPEDRKSVEGTTPLCLAVTTLLLAVALWILSLLILKCTRNADHQTVDLHEMINRARQTGNYYAQEDTQAAHELVYRHDAILDNPFVAYSFYDNNGQLIIQNGAMKQLGANNVANHRQPLYNAEGKVSNYFVAISCQEGATT